MTEPLKDGKKLAAHVIQKRRKSLHSTRKQHTFSKIETTDYNLNNSFSDRYLAKTKASKCYQSWAGLKANHSAKTKTDFLNR